MRKIKVSTSMKSIKRLSKSTILLLFKAIYTLVKNLLHIIYILIYNFNNLMSNIYLKLPRIMRVIVIYSLIILSMNNFIRYNKTTQETSNNEVLAFVQEENIETKDMEELESIELENVKEEEESTKTCNLSKDIECKIYNRGLEKGLTHNQSLLLVAISKHETGNWTSSIYKNHYNFGGLMSKGKLAQYNNIDEGLDAFINCLQTWYFNKGLTTPEKIQPIYCPVGAKNDPNGLNQYWLNNVNNYYNEYLNK